MEYNKAIRNVVNYYASHKSNSFAVMYQEFDIDLTTFPVEGLSNIDCFHPRYTFLIFYIIFEFIISLKTILFSCVVQSLMILSLKFFGIILYFLRVNVVVVLSGKMMSISDVLKKTIELTLIYIFEIKSFFFIYKTLFLFTINLY
jgi:hypothetical protein